MGIVLEVWQRSDDLLSRPELHTLHDSPADEEDIAR